MIRARGHARVSVTNISHVRHGSALDPVALGVLAVIIVAGVLAAYLGAVLWRWLTPATLWELVGLAFLAGLAYAVARFVAWRAEGDACLRAIATYRPDLLEAGPLSARAARGLVAMGELRRPPPLRPGLPSERVWTPGWQVPPERIAEPGERAEWDRRR